MTRTRPLIAGPAATRGAGCLAVAALLATVGACSGDGAREPDIDAGPLGTVVVEPGEAVQIRSLNSISGELIFHGLPIQRGVELAVADYGPIHGFDVDIGRGYDDLCSGDGGQSAAQTIIADADVVGVIGTTCSVAAVAAAPLITAAGMVMISATNASPSLTSDLAGNPGTNHHLGYYRTSYNGLVVGEALARFVYEELGLSTAATVHDGDPHTRAVTKAFADNLESLGGTVTRITAVNKEDTDMVTALIEIASTTPQAVFFSLFQPAGDFFADQARSVPGLEDVTLIADVPLLNDPFLALPQSEGLYFASPDQSFGNAPNESTGRTAIEVATHYETVYGEPPSAPYWAHSYDAAAMLLEAVASASRVIDGALVIDRSAVREHLRSVSGYSGLVGTLTCDEYGDCGTQRVLVVHHRDRDDIEATKSNIVYQFAPSR